MKRIGGELVLPMEATWISAGFKGKSGLTEIMAKSPREIAKMLEAPLYEERKRGIEAISNNVAALVFVAKNKRSYNPDVSRMALEMLGTMVDRINDTESLLLIAANGPMVDSDKAKKKLSVKAASTNDEVFLFQLAKSNLGTLSDYAFDKLLHSAQHINSREILIYLQVPNGVRALEPEVLATIKERLKEVSFDTPFVSGLVQILQKSD